MSVTEARSDLCRLIDRVNEDNTPIQITGKRSGAVLISTEGYFSIE
ncbi:MAG: type II toxin-antitoxin system Phd/YefM family antitoxin [Verrucomicrobia bacterium]|nr:type II toxin-antitoxin system Phd/YefM family antitoxin [Verrucomicrobiota bacterium]